MSPPIPPAGFEGAAALPADGPVLLAQPPNSSSAATLGVGLKPPPDPGTMGVLAKEEPPQPRPLDEAFVSAGLCCAGAEGAAAAKELPPPLAHSFPPQASAPDMPVIPKAPVDAGAGTGAGTAEGLFWVDDRSKTELVCGLAGGLFWVGGGAVG